MEAMIDGSYSVVETESAVAFQEAAGYELISLGEGGNVVLTSGPAAKPANFASFRRLTPPGTLPNGFRLVELTPAVPVTTVIADQLAHGWNLILVGTIYISSKEGGRVAAFRQA